jgi:hypothetical protein
MERLLASLVEAPHADGQQGAVFTTLDAELDGATTHLAVFDIRGLVCRQVDACFQPFTAIGTLHRHEFLGQQAPGHSGTRLIDRFETVELVDAARIEAGDTAPERFELDGFSAFHRPILRDDRCKRLRAAASELVGTFRQMTGQIRRNTGGIALIEAMPGEEPGEEPAIDAPRDIVSRGSTEKKPTVL